MIARRLILAACSAAALLAAAPAHAQWYDDHDGWRDRPRHEEMERRHEWREREWREHEWRERHAYYPPPPPYYAPRW